MTNKEAIISSLIYPVQDATVTKMLIDRGMDGDADYTGTTREYELAFADIVSLTATAPKSVSEGGFSISPADGAQLQALANRIYKKYGEANPYGSTPQITDKSNIW